MRTIVAIVMLALATPAFAQTAMDPARAVAATAQGDVEGVFEMQVASTGASGFDAYLNSAEDYRDPANLTVELHAGAITELRARLGGYPQDLLKGKHVRVKGIARRVPIPKRDGTTYHQTRIRVDAASQIEILD